MILFIRRLWWLFKKRAALWCILEHVGQTWCSVCFSASLCPLCINRHCFVYLCKGVQTDDVSIRNGCTPVSVCVWVLLTYHDVKLHACLKRTSIVCGGNISGTKREERLVVFFHFVVSQRSRSICLSTVQQRAYRNISLHGDEETEFMQTKSGLSLYFRLTDTAEEEREADLGNMFILCLVGRWIHPYQLVWRWKRWWQQLDQDNFQDLSYSFIHSI